MTKCFSTFATGRTNNVIWIFLNSAEGISDQPHFPGLHLNGARSSYCGCEHDIFPFYPICACSLRSGPQFTFFKWSLKLSTYWEYVPIKYSNSLWSLGVLVSERMTQAHIPHVLCCQLDAWSLELWTCCPPSHGYRMQFSQTLDTQSRNIFTAELTHCLVRNTVYLFYYFYVHLWDLCYLISYLKLKSQNICT